MIMKKESKNIVDSDLFVHSKYFADMIDIINDKILRLSRQQLNLHVKE